MSLSHDAFFTGEFMKKKKYIFQYDEFEPCKEALYMYNGTVADDIHMFADILYSVLIHKIQNKVTPRIKLFKT